MKKTRENLTVHENRAGTHVEMYTLCSFESEPRKLHTVLSATKNFPPTRH